MTLYRNTYRVESARMARHDDGSGTYFAAICTPARAACRVTTTNLSHVIGSVKSAVTRWCRQHGHAEFSWQSRYYDHLVRSERDAECIRGCLAANPFLWDWREHERDHQWLRTIIKVETGPAPSLQGA